MGGTLVSELNPFRFRSSQRKKNPHGIYMYIRASFLKMWMILTAPNHHYGLQYHNKKKISTINIRKTMIKIKTHATKE